MKKCESLKTLFTFVLLFCVVVACRQSGGSSDNSKTVKSLDGKFQITIPDDWTTKPLNPNEQIRSESKTGESGVILTSMPKAAAANGMTLDEFSDNLRNLSIKNGAADVSAIVSIIINGSDARQFEQKQTTDNIGVVCLVSAVETPDHFHQLVSCTLARLYDEKRKASVKEVVNSFRAVPASNSDANSTPSP